MESVEKMVVTFTILIVFGLLINGLLENGLLDKASFTKNIINTQGTILELSKEKKKTLFGDKNEYTIVIRDKEGNIYKTDEEDCYYKLYNDIKEKDDVEVEMTIEKGKDSKILSIDKIKKIDNKEKE